MAQVQSPYQAYQQALTAELKELFSARQGFLYNILRYHLGWVDQRGQPETLDASAPAPHLPAMLALTSCQALTGGFQPALPVAAAVDLVYNFTLVHGDVQAGRADAQARPSVWWVWGPAQAINAGDGLHALGRAAIMRLGQLGVSPERVLRGVEAIDRACLALCEGQYLDLGFQDQLIVTRSQYDDMVQRKAGALTGCAAELGALAAGADDAACARFREAGTRMGMAWQVGRDIADLWGQRGDGMTPSTVLNKKKGLPLVYALETAPPAVKRELGTVYMKRVLEPADVARLVQILDEVGARSYAEGRARELAGQALAALEDTGLRPEGLEAFRHLGDWALEGAA
jgi:geranylgeranyl diphosphate synthase type I